MCTNFPCLRVDIRALVLKSEAMFVVEGPACAFSESPRIFFCLKFYILLTRNSTETQFHWTWECNQRIPADKSRISWFWNLSESCENCTTGRCHLSSPRAFVRADEKTSWIFGFQVSTAPSFYRGHPLRPHRTSADVSWGLKQWLIRSHGQSDEKNECRRVVPVLKSRLKLTSHRGHPRITAPSNLRSPQMSAGV